MVKQPLLAVAFSLGSIGAELRRMKLQAGAGDAIIAGGGGGGGVRGVGAVHEVFEAVAHGAALVDLVQDLVHHLLGAAAGVPLAFRGLAGLDDRLELAPGAIAIVVELADLGEMGGAGKIVDLDLLGRSLGGGEHQREQGEENQSGEHSQNANEITVNHKISPAEVSCQ